jgi:hypothetical protein
MKIKWQLVFILSSLLTIFPFTALANAATPLIWTQFIYLVFGNAVIAVIEGRLLSSYCDFPQSLIFELKVSLSKDTSQFSIVC